MRLENPAFVSGEGGFALIELSIILAILGFFGLMLVAIIWQASIIFGAVGADQVTLSDIRYLTNRTFFEDGSQAQSFALGVPPDYISFAWTDLSQATPSFQSARYKYGSAVKTVFRDFRVQHQPASRESASRHISIFEDAGFRRTKDYLETTVKSTSHTPLEPWSNRGEILVQPRAGQVENLPAGGYVIFVAGTGGQQLRWSGSESGLIGNVYVNGSMSVSGSNHLVAGTVEAVGDITVGGSNNFFEARNSAVPVRTFPVSFTLEQFQPFNFDFPGDADLGGIPQVWLDSQRSVLKPGVYRATGRIKLANSNVRGKVTFVASSIEISGSNIDLIAFHRTGVLFHATGTGTNVIKVSGSSVVWTGIFYAPNGEIQLSGSDLVGDGSLYAAEVNWSGSKGRIAFDADLF